MRTLGILQDRPLKTCKVPGFSHSRDKLLGLWGFREPRVQFREKLCVSGAQRPQVTVLKVRSV